MLSLSSTFPVPKLVLGQVKQERCKVNCVAAVHLLLHYPPAYEATQLYIVEHTQAPPDALPKPPFSVVGQLKQRSAKLNCLVKLHPATQLPPVADGDHFQSPEHSQAPLAARPVPPLVFGQLKQLVERAIWNEESQEAIQLPPDEVEFHNSLLRQPQLARFLTPDPRLVEGQVKQKVENVN